MNRHNFDCDLLVVGGGINGAGIARDAAGRGLSVVLCEKDDLAAHTSSASTKLIHGGLRYLEYYEFGLVRKALIEREVLLRSAPHLIRPLRFVMPHDQGQRPSWMIRAGLMLYDCLARRELLPGSRGVSLARHISGAPLRPEFKRGYIYSDACVDDARLVVANAIDAVERGAKVFTRTACRSLSQQGDHWQVALQPEQGDEFSLRARCIVNATGPWAADFLHRCAHHPSGNNLRLIKGSHIVVKRLFDHPYAYIFQHPDGRIVFAIPYEQEFTLIGTTDIDYRGDLGKIDIAPDEILYLCELTNRYFRKSIAPTDVVWSYSGVRPLVEDEAGKASAVTRDYRFELDQGGAPMLSVFGGKITTFRKLAEEAVNLIAPLLSNHAGSWTAKACLPGGDLFGMRPSNRSVKQFERYVADLQQRFPWLSPDLVRRYARAYGNRIMRLLNGRNCVADMGEEVATGIYAAELEYLITREWAQTAEDILWRRSKLGLHLPEAGRAAIDDWLAIRIAEKYGHTATV